MPTVRSRRSRRRPRPRAVVAAAVPAQALRAGLEPRARARPRAPRGRARRRPRGPRAPARPSVNAHLGGGAERIGTRRRGTRRLVARAPGRRLTLAGVDGGIAGIAARVELVAVADSRRGRGRFPCARRCPGGTPVTVISLPAPREGTQCGAGDRGSGDPVGLPRADARRRASRAAARRPPFGDQVAVAGVGLRASVSMRATSPASPLFVPSNVIWRPTAGAMPVSNASRNASTSRRRVVGGRRRRRS